jgi:hypothetical protein
VGDLPTPPVSMRNDRCYAVPDVERGEERGRDKVIENLS